MALAEARFDCSNGIARVPVEELEVADPIAGRHFTACYDLKKDEYLSRLKKGRVIARWNLKKRKVIKALKSKSVKTLTSTARLKNIDGYYGKTKAIEWLHTVSRENP